MNLHEAARRRDLVGSLVADVPDFPAERRFRVDAGIVSAL